MFVRIIIAAIGIISTHAADADSVPIIDVSSFAKGSAETRQVIADSVGQAFADFGFAVIIGHGVNDSIFDEAYDAGKEFFRQPLDQKLQYDVGKGYGFGGYLSHMETGGGLTGEKKNSSDGVESLTLRGLQHLPPSHVCLGAATSEHFAQDMSDVPRADAVPCSPPSLLPSVKKLHAALFEFKETMTSVTQLALGAFPGDFHHVFDPAKGGFRFAYYPEMKHDPVAQNVDYGAHADSGSMVFLRLDRDNPAGTQVVYDGKWLDVPSVPGGIVVNLGTVLSRLTGGRWKAAVHRATRIGRKERMSLVLGALVPRNDLTLECLPHICGVESGERRQVSVKEYLDARVRLQRPDKSAEDQDIVRFIDELV